MRTIACLLLLLLGSIAVGADLPEGRLVEIVAAGDNTFRVANAKSAVIRAHAGEIAAETVRAGIARVDRSRRRRAVRAD